MNKALNTLFADAIDPTDAREAEKLFEQRAGVYVGSVHELADEIAGDLDSTQFGIGWWAPHPDDRRRIFISDYLLQCVNSVSNNAVEASLHLMSAQHAHEAVSSQMAHSVVMRPIGQGQFVPHDFAVPQPTTLADLLPSKLADLHVAGFFRAAGSLLDTLAAITIAVGAFEMGIVRVEFRRLIAHLDKRPFGATPGAQLQKQVKDALFGAVGAAGPAGWLDWTLDFRNMLVHRGRRTQFHNIAREPGPILVSPDGMPMPRARIVMQLARDPKNTDLQAFFSGSVEPTRLANVLEEDGLHTLQAAMKAVVYVLKELSAALLDAWRTRRASPGLLIQPNEQWPDLAIHPDNFGGFEPGTFPASPDMMFGSPARVRRLSAAAVDTAHRYRWKTFTGT